MARHTLCPLSALRRLRDRFDARGLPDGLVIAGVAPESCVLAKAQGARMRDLPFRVSSDATAAIRAARKPAALTVILLGMWADTRGVARMLADL